MLLSDFQFELPDELIAQYPCPERDASRLLYLSAESNGRNVGFADKKFNQLPELLNPGDILVLNNTKVIPARLYGHKKTGGKVEIVVERIVSKSTFIAQTRSNKKLVFGTVIIIEQSYRIEIISKQGSFFELRVLDDIDIMALLSKVGHMPIPPYISRSDDSSDRNRYQTVYADIPGAVAAPTAGLHFTDELIQVIRSKGVNIVYVTLHVGAGTYQPVRVDNIEDHLMHHEWLEVTQDVCDKIAEGKNRGARIIAVGTTSVRCLETAALSGTLAAYNGDTNIFIYPGFKFNVIDGLITNFHLSQSTLLMLVSALAGQDKIKLAYQYAIEHQYRFFSYGDAMFIDV